MPHRTLQPAICVCFTACLAGAPARAAEPLTGWSIEAGAFVALPALLDVTETVGGELGVGFRDGLLTIGLTTSLSRAVRDTFNWHEQYLELRARAQVGVAVAAGRALWGARLGLGVTTLHIVRATHVLGPYDNHPHLKDDVWAAIPSLALEFGVTLTVARDVGIALYAGPTLHFGSVANGEEQWGWFGSAGLAWTP